MARTQNAAPSGKSIEAATGLTTESQSTPCDHLAEAAEWLAKAKRAWNGESEAAARIAQLHIELADRTEALGQCGVTEPVCPSCGSSQIFTNAAGAVTCGNCGAWNPGASA